VSLLLRRVLLVGIVVTAVACSSADGQGADMGGGGSQQCTPGYSPCLPPASDYDCAGGSGDGPNYTGPVRLPDPIHTVWMLTATASGASHERRMEGQSIVEGEITGTA
jgi:hypothetical protein